jgi:hypothetical protein
MPESSHAHDVARLIQLAVAPVFLLTAVSSTLSLLAARLARIVDRGRTLEGRATLVGLERIEMVALERRARLVYLGLSLGACAAILVSLLIALAFVGYLLEMDLSWIIAGMFVAAMLAFTATLVCFLREVFLAIKTFQLVVPRAQGSPPG